MSTHTNWMKQALIQARLAEIKGEVPVGAVVVKDNQMIGFGHNKVISANNATAHAEVNAIQAAGAYLNNYRLSGCDMYVTIEPCTMCAGAIVHARINHLIIGAREPKAGVVCSHLNIFEQPFINHRLNVTEGVLADECRQIVQSFFKNRRQQAKVSNRQ